LRKQLIDRNSNHDETMAIYNIRLAGEIDGINTVKEIVLSSQKESLTIGDKIRESNESLADAIYNRIICRACPCRCNNKLPIMECRQMWIDYLNQPSNDNT
jgi:hypothetical protein